jgi:hypothetical protein
VRRVVCLDGHESLEMQVVSGRTRSHILLRYRQRSTGATSTSGRQDLSPAT